MIISPYHMVISPYHMVISSYHMIISPYYMIISPYYMIISPYYMIISPYHIIKSPYHIIKSPHDTIKSLGHMIKSNPTDTSRLFKRLPGLRGARLGKHLAPSSKSTHKITKKTPKVRKKKGPRKRWGEILFWKVAPGHWRPLLQKGSSKSLLEN